MKSSKDIIERLSNNDREILRERIRSDPFMPRALEFLRAKELCDIDRALGGLSPQKLVDLRYQLADAFAQHVLTMRGDPTKPNRTERREALERLALKARILKKEAEHNLPWLRDEHNAASFFGASGSDPSPFEYDYACLVKAVNRLELIASAILPPRRRSRSSDRPAPDR